MGTKAGRQFLSGDGFLLTCSTVAAFAWRGGGVRLALFAYLRMRSGADAVKPDGRLRTNLARLGFPQSPGDDVGLVLVAEAAAAELRVERLVLDQLLWLEEGDRHYFASLLIRSGASIKVVQARLGHSSAKTSLDIYAHLFADEDDRTGPLSTPRWDCRGPSAAPQIPDCKKPQVRLLDLPRCRNRA